MKTYVVALFLIAAIKFDSKTVLSTPFIES